jgi:hypothetical protein
MATENTNQQAVPSQGESIHEKPEALKEVSRCINHLATMEDRKRRQEFADELLAILRRTVEKLEQLEREH